MNLSKIIPSKLIMSEHYHFNQIKCSHHPSQPSAHHPGSVVALHSNELFNVRVNYYYHKLSRGAWPSPAQPDSSDPVLLGNHQTHDGGRRPQDGFVLLVTSSRPVRHRHRHSLRRSIWCRCAMIDERKRHFDNLSPGFMATDFGFKSSPHLGNAVPSG